jgi:thiol-disulfide isomerase/thioredoxin
MFNQMAVFPGRWGNACRRPDVAKGVTLIPSQHVSLSDLVDSHDRLAVLFWASWCPHCQRFRPVFEAVAAAHPDITFATRQIDGDETVESEFDDLNLTGVPAVLLFADGEWVDSLFGELSPAMLNKAFNQLRTTAVPVG